jgi:hypothetical protein
MSKLKIGLVPMSAKPYHRGHHALVQIAALGSASDAALEGAPDNDVVIVFVSYSSRGTKPGTKASGGKERVTPGEVPVFGSDMKYIWEELLLPNLDLPSNVIVRTPSTGAPASPITGVRKVLDAVHGAKLAGMASVKIPYTDITVDPNNAELTIYSDDVDIDGNYPNKEMERQYPGSFGTLIKKFGVPRSKTVQISGTKMRDHLCKGDKAEFIAMLPDLPSGVANGIFNLLSVSAIAGVCGLDGTFTAIATVYSLDADDVSPGQDITNHPHIRGNTENDEDDPLKAVVTSDTYHGRPLIKFTFRSADNAENWFQEVNDDFEGDWMLAYENRDGGPNAKAVGAKIGERAGPHGKAIMQENNFTRTLKMDRHATLRELIRVILESRTPRMSDLTQEDLILVIEDILGREPLATYTEKLAGQNLTVYIEGGEVLGQYKDKEKSSWSDLSGVADTIRSSSISRSSGDTKFGFEVLKPESRPDYLDYVIGDNTVVVEFTGALTAEMAKTLNREQGRLKFLSKADITKRPRPLSPATRSRMLAFLEELKSSKKFPKDRKVEIEASVSEAVAEVFGESIFGGPVEGIFVTGASKGFKIPEKEYADLQRISAPLYAVFSEKSAIPAQTVYDRFEKIALGEADPASDRIWSDLTRYFTAASAGFRAGYKTFFSPKEAQVLRAKMEALPGSGDARKSVEIIRSVRRRIGNKLEWHSTKNN